MKNYYLLLLLMLPISGNLLAQTVPNPELLYYRFEGTGTSVPNEALTPPSGTTTATIMGSVTQGSGGVCGGSLIGSGNASSTDYLNTGYAPNLTSAWTISIRSKDITSSSTLFYIFGDANSSSFRCFTNGVAGPNNWILRGPFTDVLVSGGAIVAPTMTTFVYDPTLGDIKGYLNGVLVTTVAQSSANIVGTGPLKVMGYSTNVGSPAGGKLDEFRLYDRALTAAEVAQLYNPLAGTTFLGADFSICEGYSDELVVPVSTSSYVWNDMSTNDSLTVTTAGQYFVDVTGECGSGKDTVNVTVSPTTYSSTTEISCGDFTAPSGTVYSMTGIYTDTVANSVGCDSVITIDLTVNLPSTSTLTISSCGDYAAPSGAVFSTSGMYNDTIPNAVGCDSIITIDLTVNQPTSASQVLTGCDYYIVASGAQYNTSGVYYDTIPNAAGCDSIITYDLTIIYSTTANITVSTCGDYTAPSGAVYSTSGTYVDHIMNAVGCDSTINIDLTVTNINNAVMNNNNVLTAIQNGATYEWVDCSNGQVIAGETGQTFTPIANGSYAAVITMNNCTDTSSCVTVSTIGLSENAVGIFEAFPNPTTGQLTITNTAQVPVTYVLMDINGKTLQTISATDANVTLDLSAYSTGVYLVKAMSKTSTYEMRIIKQ